ncbi:hypothetical protein [Candidatus Methylacidithermus pantelleriae]|uniref:Uncharacterized protein n=1 Tax=Candidatus Methylacidithermus pantelleriae TaxID=2744239 RepID=A0A8J2BRM2_9BACT|nr:hypothetical protein [Candidatus Methylacidithermus pantelleriae]CAF0705004.1 hypothetical protein MPNT_80062 [Candidatus Methylacidithermus pantelleriae]
MIADFSEYQRTYGRAALRGDSLPEQVPPEAVGHLPVGTLELQISTPPLGSYFPGLLGHRRRA